MSPHDVCFRLFDISWNCYLVSIFYFVNFKIKTTPVSEPQEISLSESGQSYPKTLLLHVLSSWNWVWYAIVPWRRAILPQSKCKSHAAEQTLRFPFLERSRIKDSSQDYPSHKASALKAGVYTRSALCVIRERLGGRIWPKWSSETKK